MCCLQVSLDALYARADVITLHTPGGKDTKNLISSASLAKCKNGVFIVNAARGGVINEADLLDALNADKVTVSYSRSTVPEPIHYTILMTMLSSVVFGLSKVEL